MRAFRAAYYLDPASLEATSDLVEAVRIQRAGEAENSLSGRACSPRRPQPATNRALRPRATSMPRSPRTSTASNANVSSTRASERLV